MPNHRLIKISIPLCISLSILLSGCQNHSDTSAASSANSTDTASSGLVTFGSRQYVLPPGSTQRIVKTDLSKLKKITFTSSQPQLIAINAAGEVQVSADAAVGTKATITSSYNGATAECAIIVKYSLLETLTTNAKGKKVVTNPADLAAVVNKQRSLPDTYIPADLVEPKIPFTFKAKVEKRMLRSIAAKALEDLFAQAEKDNIHLFGVSGYRSFATQKSVFGGNVKDKGNVEANKISALPGQSEHQTGLAIDLTNAVPQDQLVESFGDSKEGIWLAAHAADFGFIIRYLKAKESLTGYSYEPWHIRFVGKEMAQEIYAKKITLEQYFDDAVAVQGSQ